MIDMKAIKRHKSWFETLMGFEEGSKKLIRDSIQINQGLMISRVNGKAYSIGNLQITTLFELQKKSRQIDMDHNSTNTFKVAEIIDNTMTLHAFKGNEKALFQVASQFNLLEMMHPSISPSQGVSRYEYDSTQGPACAISCGAATIYRNYFLEHNNYVGQIDKQIDCLDLIAEHLDNENNKYWTMTNGYALLNKDTIKSLDEKLSKMSEDQIQSIKDKLKVGIQWNTQVTLNNCTHKVSQIYCSALPLSYCNVDKKYCERFARLVLEALYEATLYTAIINSKNSNTVYLTLVGSGAFGNDEDWVLNSLYNTLVKFKKYPLNVRVVSYKNTNLKLNRLISKM